jgi:hypothetical protein
MTGGRGTREAYRLIQPKTAACQKIKKPPITEPRLTSWTGFGIVAGHFKLFTKTDNNPCRNKA